MEAAAQNAKNERFKEIKDSSLHPHMMWQDTNNVLGQNQRQGISVVRTSCGRRNGSLSEGQRAKDCCV